MAELEQEEMSFWDHLEALRWTLFRSYLLQMVVRFEPVVGQCQSVV